MYLARMFRCTLDVLPEHEAKPTIVGFPELLRLGANATYEARRAAKVPALYAELNRTVGFHYADISHMFIKSWGDVVLDELLQYPEQ